MVRRRTLRPEEREIWARVAKHVTPRPGRSVPKSAGDHGAGKPSASVTMAASALAVNSVGVAKRGRRASAETVSAAKRAAKPVPGGKKPSAPADCSYDKRVRRGKVEIDGRLDLHGLNQNQAQAALFDFIHRGVARGASCLLVITGKGAGDDAAGEFLPWWREAPGVIKRRCPEWLAAPDLRPYVSRTARAHQRHGGDGALYVFLRKRTG